MSLWAKGRLFPPMTISNLSIQRMTHRLRHGWQSWAVACGVVLLAVALSQAIVAQVAGERGIAPVASSSDISVGGIEVNASGRNSQDARKNGWLLAQRKAWEKVGGPKISDSDLEDMVSAMVIESEQIGPRRYIARLGVVFDRTRAGALIGSNDGPIARSAPMLTIPVLRSGGTYTVYETRNMWQRAWAEYQAGASAIDYVRPAGAGGDSLLINYGQLNRRSRVWWRNVLDAFGAADVVFPIAHLERQWPGGPVKGTFTARYGPDNLMLESFTLTAPNEEAVPAMLQTALTRFDAIFTRALGSGTLQPDPTLRADKVTLNPTIAALIEAERRASAAQETIVVTDGPALPGQPVTSETSAAQAVASHVVQFATPDGATMDATIGAVRGIPGVRGASISSTAIGGVSVMRVSYTGDLAALAAALRARGFSVTQGSSALSISR